MHAHQAKTGTEVNWYLRAVSSNLILLSSMVAILVHFWTLKRTHKRTFSHTWGGGDTISWHEVFGKWVPSIILPRERRKRKLCVLAAIEKWIPHRCWFKPYGCYLNLACHKSSIYHSICSPSHFICVHVQRIAVARTKMCHCSQKQVSPELCRWPPSIEMFILKSGSPKSFWTFISGDPMPNELL